MARLGVIEIDQLPAMQVLEVLDSENTLNQRMQEFVALWKKHDPPVGAQYDVSQLEFDPIKINQECNTFFELLLRDRVNQAAKSVTLAFASGTDLDAIGSRYPGGMPRLAGETDDHYRMRIWLSPNTLSPHGTYDSYVFWALSGDSTLRDATAVARRGTPEITITIMADSGSVQLNATKDGILPYPNVVPTNLQLDAVRIYVGAHNRKALTDVVSVRTPKLVHTTYEIDYWLFPTWDVGLLQPELYQAIADLLNAQRWLGYSHTRDSIDAALKRSGVYKIHVKQPVVDIEIDQHEVVVIDSVLLRFAGRGGFEEPIEP